MGVETINRLQPMHLANDVGLIRALLATVVVLFFLRTFTFRLRRYLQYSHIPGPPTTGWSAWWLLYKSLGGECHKVFYETNKKYGPIAKVGPYHLITSDPDLIRKINSVRTQYVRGEWYQALRFDPDKDNLVTCTPEKHLELRTKMAAGYSGKEVEGIEARVNKNILALVDLIETRYLTQNRLFDFGRKAQYFTLDVISDLAYGDPFGFLEKDADQHSYIKITEEQFSMLLTLTIYPWIVSLLSSPLLKSLLPTEDDPFGFGKFMGIAKQKAAERFGPHKKIQKDMLGSFVAHGLSQQEAEAEILFQIVAGSDTTATAIRTTLLLILSTPRVYVTLLSEIASAVGNLPLDSVIPNDQARGMPYLQAVIKEGLRWFPPVTGMMSKQVPRGGDEWKGVALPAGAQVGFCLWGVMRDASFWGEDADEFRPERWLETQAMGVTVGTEKRKEMEARVGLIFGYGKWQCLGKEVALMELNKVFVELLRRFDLSVADPTSPWKSVCASIFMQSDFWMRAYRRDLASLISK